MRSITAAQAGLYRFHPLAGLLIALAIWRQHRAKMPLALYRPNANIGKGRAEIRSHKHGHRVVHKRGILLGLPAI